MGANGDGGTGGGWPLESDVSRYDSEAHLRDVREGYGFTPDAPHTDDIFEAHVQPVDAVGEDDHAKIQDIDGHDTRSTAVGIQDGRLHD